MNETKKQIIEIVEPYMEKELRRGCLVMFQDYFYTLGDVYEIHNERGEEFLYGMYEGRLSDDYNTYKIIGHYDITAVLKYIEDKSFNNTYLQLENGMVRNKNSLEGNLGFTDIKLLIKPLHLYTEQEEKDLLELLQELNV